MAGSRFIRIFGLLIVLVLAFAVSAQPSPRSAPENDNFASATTLVPGTTMKAKDPAAATEEASEPNPCGQPAVHNSVWYTFTPSTNGILAVSVGGTQLIDPIFSTSDAYLEVYNGSALGALTPMACARNTGGSPIDIVFAFSAGTTYSMQFATAQDVQYSPKSFYSLTTRFFTAQLTPANSSFESALSASDWKLKQATGDGIVCSDPEYPASVGLCAFRFMGNAGEKAKLTQTIAIPKSYHFRKGGWILFGVYFSVVDAQIGNAKLTVTLTYSDGTPPTKATIILNGSAISGYQAATGITGLASAKLSKITVQAASTSATGALLLDRVTLNYSASPLLRDGGVLPVPPPAGAN